MAIRTQTQDGMVAVSTGHYAFTIDVQAQRWTFAPADGGTPVLAARSAFPLTPQLATGELALANIAAEFIGTASGCSPRRLRLTATITGTLKGELCNEIHFLEERVIVNGWYRLSQDHALAHWQVAPCGSRLSADTVQAYLGVHGAIDEMNGTVWSARDVELSTASHNWMYAGAVPRVVLSRGPFSVCLGGTEVAHDFGLELKCRQGIAEYFRFNYGGAQAPQAATAGDEVRSPRLQLLVTQSQHPDQTQAAFTRAMQADGIVPRKHYRPEDETWRRPWYCTWADQVGLAAARMAQDQGGGRDYQAIKDVLTQDMVLKTARLIRARDINIGTIIIDDGWQDLRGDWNLDAKKFPDMRGLVDELHRLDFKVALWWAPFIVEKRALIHTRPGFVVGSDPRHGEMLVDYSRKEVREWAEALLDIWFSTGPRGWAVDGIKLDFLAEKTYASTHSAEPGWRGEECLWQQLFALMDRVIRRYTGSPGLLHVPFNPHLAPFCVAVHGEERFDQELGYLTLRPALVDALLPGVWFAPSFNYNPLIVPDFIRSVKRVGGIVQVGKLISPDVTPDILGQIRELLADADGHGTGERKQKTDEAGQTLGVGNNRNDGDLCDRRRGRGKGASDGG